MKGSDYINSILPPGIKGKYHVKGLKSGPSVILNWSVFVQRDKNGKEKGRIGVAISAPKPEGKREFRYNKSVDFRTISKKQMDNLLTLNCPFVVKGKVPKASEKSEEKTDSEMV